MLVNDADQVESFTILVWAIHETDAVAFFKDSLFDGLRHVLLAYPSAVVTLVGVGVDKADHIFSIDKLFSHASHMLQGVLTVFLRRLNVENDILNVASFVRFVTVLVFLIESLVVGISDDHSRIGDAGITQHDDIGGSLRILVLVVFLSQSGGKEIRSLHQVVELVFQAVFLHAFFEFEPTVVILGRKLVEILEIIQSTLFVEGTIRIAEALHHPLMRVVARHLVVKFLSGDAHTSGIVFLGHEVVLDHFFQRAVVDVVSLSGRKVVVVALCLSVLKVLVLELFKVPHGNLVSIDNRNLRAGVSSLTLEKVL